MPGLCPPCAARDDHQAGARRDQGRRPARGVLGAVQIVEVDVGHAHDVCGLGEGGHALDVAGLVPHQVGTAVRIERDGDPPARLLHQGEGLGRRTVVDEGRRADMDCLDPVERQRAAAIGPVPRRRAFVIERIARLAGNGSHEGKRGLVIAARRKAEIDLRRQGVIGDHASEEIGRDAADESCLNPEPRQADGDIEAGSADDRHERVAPIRGRDRQEVDQGIAAAQHHGQPPLQERQAPPASRMAARLS